jgi:hypothetical protein
MTSLSNLSTLPLQRRLFAAQPVCDAGCCMIHLTIDTASVTSLRQLAMQVCGDALEFMRIAVCAGGARIEVWLCVRLACLGVLSETIVRQLPGADLDRQAGVGKAAP